ncbi:hypothetical protein U1Q18_008023 [Sarracenia purpurea var. burkii]
MMVALDTESHLPPCRMATCQCTSTKRWNGSSSAQSSSTTRSSSSSSTYRLKLKTTRRLKLYLSVLSISELLSNGGSLPIITKIHRRAVRSDPISSEREAICQWSSAQDCQSEELPTRHGKNLLVVSLGGNMDKNPSKGPLIQGSLSLSL